MTETVIEAPAEADPHQEEMSFAYVQGKAVTELPKDLYIPPDALEVFLEVFEGPLDLLLYLIRRQNLDILDIPIAEITRQYMEYVDVMKSIRLELAGEYLLMAAMLAEIKSRMLLPRPNEEEEEADPRAELIKRLQEYERFKKAAEDIDEVPRLERDLYLTEIDVPDKAINKPDPDVSMQEILMAFQEVMSRTELFNHHNIKSELLSVRERMTDILDGLGSKDFIGFMDLFTPEEGRLGVVVTLLAILELQKEFLINLVQADNFGPIYVKALAHDK